MSYKLAFLPSAKKEWDKLDKFIQTQFKKKLAERLLNPRQASAKLHGMQDCYKIKLKAAGYRMVYQVNDKTVLVTVIAIQKRERNLVYQLALNRL